MSALSALINPPQIFEPKGGRVVKKLNAQAPDEPPTRAAHRPKCYDKAADAQTAFTLIERQPGLSRVRIQSALGWKEHRVATALSTLIAEGSISVVMRDNWKVYFAVDA